MIEKYKHHGKVVSVQSEDKGKHRDHCLCFQGCAKFNAVDRTKNCPLANYLYDFCVKFNMTTPVWECSHYEAQK